MTADLAPPVVGLIGAGRMGSALARTYHQQGGAISAVYSRTPPHAQQLASALSIPTAATPAEVVAASDVTVIAVADDAIMDMAQSLADTGAVYGRLIVHTSGAKDAAVLAALSTAGAIVGGLHPAYPISSADDRLPPGVTYAVEAPDGALLAALSAIAARLGGVPLRIAPGQKPLYHAGLVFASNFGVTLYALARDLLAAAGANELAADGAVLALMRGMMDNLARVGSPAALTGPFTRADVGTIAAHRAALGQYDEGIAALYAALGRATLPLLRARGMDEDTIAKVTAVITASNPRSE